MDYRLLKKLSLPEDIKKLSINELNELADEIRNFMIDSVSQTGGHLASNLGVVELTIAMHYVFDSPRDQLIFDVGHQSYVHKILTGRKDLFHSLRQKGGLSGFPSPDESLHDSFKMGHSSTAVSLGLGLSTADHINGTDKYVVSLMGDGAMTGGMIYEAFSNIKNTRNNLIVILNDNKMSISKNVGFVSRYLSTIRAKPRYYKFKDSTKGFLNKIPLIGRALSSFVSWVKKSFKMMVYSGNVFETFGLTYLGPVDGHNIEALISVLRRAKQLGKPVLVHAETKKGKGYSFAENAPQTFHGISSFNIETGMAVSNAADSFSSKVGELLCHMIDQDKRIRVITAAMCEGCGLENVAAQYPKHLIDVGITEGHAVTFAAGLAKNGILPVFAVYSSFLQRGYDQLIHDVALQKQHVIFAIDRSGIVGPDGETHQGFFDVVFLQSIPNITVFAPATYKELNLQFTNLCYETEFAGAIRYPRGGEIKGELPFKESAEDFEMICGDSEVLVVTYAREIAQVLGAVEGMEIKPSILKINKIIPLSDSIVSIAETFKTILFFEEGYRYGGVGSTLGQKLLEKGFKGEYKLIAIDNQFVKHASYQEILEEFHLDSDSVANTISMYMRDGRGNL